MMRASPHGLWSIPTDPGAVVETHSAVPYAVIGGVLAFLVFTIICVLIITIWCSVRQKGNAHTRVSYVYRAHFIHSPSSALKASIDPLNLGVKLSVPNVPRGVAPAPAGICGPHLLNAAVSILLSASLLADFDPSSVQK